MITESLRPKHSFRLVPAGQQYYSQSAPPPAGPRYGTEGADGHRLPSGTPSTSAQSSPGRQSGKDDPHPIFPPAYPVSLQASVLHRYNRLQLNEMAFSEPLL